MAVHSARQMIDRLADLRVLLKADDSALLKANLWADQKAGLRAATTADQRV
jgi:hypothetical protein